MPLYSARCCSSQAVSAGDENQLEKFRHKADEHLAMDHADELVYIAPSRVNLSLTEERWPDLEFSATREHQGRKNG